MLRQLITLDVEERANVITHGVGLLLAATVAAICVVTAAVNGGALRIVAASVFGATLVGVYLTSTTFHFVTHPRRRQVWKMLDHVAIYLLIAGTYTPVVLLRFPPGWGWSIFGVVWGLAVIGIGMKLLRFRGSGGNFGWVDTALYIAMGWVGIIAVVPIVRGLDTPGTALIIAGGLAYTLGCIFFLWDTLRFNHAIWHIWVLAGSACHAIAVLGWVLPVG
ncbi:MAG: hemolysin III family protein [Planctomycetota bacterium]